MRRGKFFGLLLVVTIITIMSAMCLTACKPGYKEVWAPIEPYSYEWDSNNGDLETIKDRINADCIIEKNAERARLEKENEDRVAKGEEPKPNYADPAYLLSVMRSDGSYSSIEYDKDTKAFWPPLDHLRNTLFLQVALNDVDSEYYNKPEVRSAVSNAMAYWVEKNYVCEWNWWYNDVGVGMYLPNIILFGVDGLSDADKNSMLERIEKTLLHTKPMRFRLYERKCNEAGGNLTDQALSTLKFCLAKGDGNTIMWVTKQLENELRPFPPYKGPKYHRWDAEGPKEDYSFQQHDQLLYFGGYGEVFMDGMNKYLRYTKNTQFELGSEQLNFYAELVANGFQYATRNGYRDISASGRGASRENGLTGIYENIRRTIAVLKDYTSTSTECKLTEKNLATILKIETDRFGEVDKGAGGHKYFYMSDYNAYNGAKYMATVRHASKNTRVFEYLNGENPLAYYTGLGATFYYVNGDEYYNVMPTYDWNKVPGTTTRQGKIVKMNQDFSYSTYGKTKYVSGVSNGNVGMSYFRQNDAGVSARKAYFMFEDGVVCLGADIDSALLNNVVTNINQTRWDGDVIVGQNGTDSSVTESKTGDFEYIYHDSISYIPTSEVAITLEKGKKGDWKTINERKSVNVPIENDMFTLDISHGKMPINKTYAYTVLMNTNVEDTRAYLSNPYLEILANKKSVQAVMDTKNNVLQAVFHKEGTISVAGNTVKVNKACVMMLTKNSDGEYVVTIASHDGESRDINVTINGVTKSINAKNAPVMEIF